MPFQNTVLSLRQATARRVRDLWTGALTTAAADGDDTFFDTSRVEIENYFVNGFLHIGVDNRAQDLRISSSLPGSLTVTPVSDGAVANATAYEIHKLWSVPDYNGFIADALMSIGSEVVLANLDSDVLEVEANSDKPSGIEDEYDIPSNFRYISEVWLADQNGFFEMRIPNNQVHVVPGTRKKLRFSQWAVGHLSGRQGQAIRLLGQGIPTSPTLADTSLVYVDPGYVISYAELQALTPLAGGTTTRGIAASARVRFLNAMVDLKRADAVTEHRVLPGSIPVPA